MKLSTVSLGGRGRCVYAAPHNSNLNTNRKGLILNHMTWSTTHLSVPMATAYFLAVPLKAVAGVTHTHAHTPCLPHTHKRGILSCYRLHVLRNLRPTTKACTHKHQSTDMAEGADAKRILWCCVDPCSCENLFSVFPPPPLIYYYSLH